MKSLILACGAAVLALGTPATAQNADGAPNDPGQQQASPCEAAPGDQARKDQNEANNLGDQLGKCRGVLKPPATGDSMATPPPAKGKTPIIRPGEVPQQPPKGN